jgi:hypothetical protein
LSYANVLSTVCLFLLLGGGAWAAAKLPKNSVGSAQLRSNSVTGAKVKDGSLGGADIDASSLGTVPGATHAANADVAGHSQTADTATHAQSADSAIRADNAAHSDDATHATSADSAATAEEAFTLGGFGQGTFLRREYVKRLNYIGISCSGASGPPCSEDFLTIGGLSLHANCFFLGVPRLQLFAQGQSGSSTYALIDRSGTWDQKEIPAGEAIEDLHGEVADGSVLYVDGGSTISIDLHMASYVDGTNQAGCEVLGTALLTGNPPQPQ